MTARPILYHPPNQSADLLQLDNRRREGRRRDDGGWGWEGGGRKVHEVEKWRGGSKRYSRKEENRKTVIKSGEGSARREATDGRRNKEECESSLSKLILTVGQAA